MQDILIIGAGHAGAQAAIALRQVKFAGTITLVGDEPELPYERPPLSKEYLSGQRSFDQILLRPPAFWVERAVTLFTGRKVASVNAANHSVTLADDSELSYRKMIWAAGGRPRRLTCRGHDVAGVHSIRNRRDVDRLLHELPDTRRIVVIGGGYIGLEAAAVLSKLGKNVTVLEALDRVLARVTGEPLSRFYEAEHRAHGVDILLNTAVECIEADAHRVTGVRVAGGRVVPADMVIVGIGIVPAVEPLMAAGAAGNNGVLVDEFGRTSLPDIYAIGDCALHPNVFADGRPVRLESVQNAADMATMVAKGIMGEQQPYRAVPWFWSNQYDLRLQTVGLSTGYDLAVVRGDAKTRSFTVIYCKAGRVIALDCVNSAKEYAQGRALVVKGVVARPADLADVSVPLARLAAGATGG